MLENHRTVNHCGIQLDETINILHRICGGKPPQPAFNTDELDPAFDYDFNSVEDDGRRYMRGGFQYKRHYGWKRIAIKVLANIEMIPGLAATGCEQKKPRGNGLCPITEQI